MTEVTTITLTGVGVGRGAVVGPVARITSVPPPPADEVAPADRDAAKARVQQAFTDVAATLTERAAAAEGTLAQVLTATAQMAADRALFKDVAKRIDGGDPVLAAVSRGVERFCDMFTAMGGYMAERVTDLRSVRARVLADLMGLLEPAVPVLSEPSVIVAEDLSPADTAMLDLAKVLAVVTELGGRTSHTAIIAGQHGIPCVVQVSGALELSDGTVVAVDAAAGTVMTEPDRATIDGFRSRAAVLAELESDTEDGATADGHPVQLLVNIGQADEAVRAADRANQGSGLFRTEVLFLEATEAPTTQAQQKIYSTVLSAFGSRKVVVRTLDAGADKPLAFAHQPGEENPALGVRGYRLVRSHPELLDTQLAALAAAQETSGVRPWVMAPMIATAAEARAFASSARAHGLNTVGVMIEVPAAALRAEQILAEVDFVSLGTNDLAQYTMATDRLCGQLSDLLDPWQPAVLELISRVASAGVAAGKPVGVCGESAGDPVMGLVLAGMGVTSLSMSPGLVSTSRYLLKHHSLAECRVMAAVALAAESAESGRTAVVALVDPAAREALAL